MKDFVNRVSSKISKLTSEQIEQVLEDFADANEILQSIFDSLSDGLLICDINWNIKTYNKILERFVKLNFRNADLHHLDSKENIPVWEIVQDKDVSEFLKKVADSNKSSASKEFNLEVASGKVRIVNIIIIPMIVKYSLKGFIIQFNDITDKRNQEILYRRMDNLSSLTNLAANVAHEIKNPLGAISIHVQLIEKAIKKARSGDGLLPQEKFTDRYLNIINEEIERLNKIIVDFLYAVRPVSAEIEPLNLKDFFHRFYDFFQPECEEKNIEFKLEIDDNLPVAMVDEKLLKQVLLNLAKNSLAAMKDGGLFFVSLKKKGDEIIITVADNGCGMSQETMERIFEPYFTTKIDGTGLGLTMAYKIIREFGGNIEVKSTENKGTVFIITLPCGQTKQYVLEDLR